jgi:hypothetical protein
MKPVADLHGPLCTDADRTAVGRRTVAANHLNTRMGMQPGDGRGGLPGAPGIDGQAGFRVDHERGVPTSAPQCEVVNGDHPQSRCRRIGGLHQTSEQTGPAQDVVQVKQQP